ncbi:LCP family protein [Nocardiopsis sp. LSu2-4]|uniref:LCP family protein n=2 Tax=Nocardiopsis suaedae TaxID=3018444 RepID=A0ABT4TN09_9ACTN|nr:LCP family protein [Nocardiopsis suaedae]MDA2805482.1 LCP family protein [Nocardiopsis suaedae]
MVSTGLVILSLLTGYGVYFNIYNKINQEQIDFDEWGDRPTRIDGVMNIMIIGSDVRSGANSEYGDAEGERPDVLAVAHISPEKKSATLVNIPRDSIVDLPQCEAKDDKPGQQAHTAMIGEAMNNGGVECLWKTVEDLTDVHIDHFVSLDFTGFKEMVDAVGGVTMCIPEPIQDKNAGHLDLEAGEQKLNGEEALGYVRSRKGQGDGSDLSRISRQQDFMGAMLKTVMSGDVLSSPTTLNSFLGSVADSLTTDDGLTVSTMGDIGVAMREVDLDDVEFITVPNGPHPADANRVAWSEPKASQLWQQVAADEIGGGSEDDGGGSGGGKEEEKVDPSGVSVEVLNGTSIPGLANEVSTGLTTRGFQPAGTGNPTGQVPPETTVYYGPGQKAAAEAVAKTFTNGTTEENSALGDTVQVIVSQDWDGFKASGGGSSGGGGGGGADIDSKSASDAKVACD